MNPAEMSRKPRVMVVDDEKSMRFTLETFLSEEGYEVQTAGNFESAVELLAGGGFDLVFADIILGDKTGIDVLRRVKESRLICPVIMITGFPNMETATEAVRLGAFDYLPKPVVKKDILHVADHALQYKMMADRNEANRLNLEAVFRSVKDAIITLDSSLAVVDVNDAAQHICGFPREVIGRPFLDISTACRGRCHEAVRESIEKGQPVEFARVECTASASEKKVVNITASPLLDQRWKASGVVLVVRDETHIDTLERDMAERRKFHSIVGRSRKMQEIYSLIETLADVQSTVLISGESGTGKELIAEAIHARGPRSGRPIIKVNCSGLAESLLESELFGHVKGAFTGAIRDKEGRFERADGGTIFLDEIGSMSQNMQLRLLRVLQEREFERVGDATPVKVDVRVLAATNQPLHEKVRKGEFREDLYYRLKVVEIIVPPLRERREDIPLLVDHFIQKFNSRMKREVGSVSDNVQKIFMDYPWPGNVRELEHTLEHAFILCRNSMLTVDHLPAEVRDFNPSVRQLPEASGRDEQQRLLQALEKAGGNKAKAARLLGIDRKTLYRKLEKHSIPLSESSI